jgi:hypothetical protein
VASILKAAVAYFLVVFAPAFLMGTLRVLWIAPAIGELGAVIAELPVILLISWMACKFVVRHFSIAACLRDRIAMGGMAFLLLMATELTISVVFFNQTASDYFGQFHNPVSLLGLMGQVAFAAVPVAQLKIRL